MAETGWSPASAAMSAGRWQVQLLGGLEARSGDIVIRDFGGRKAAALFARLLVESNETYRRESLAEWLWPRTGKHRDRREPDGVSTQLKRLRRVLFKLNNALSVGPSMAVEAIVADRWTVKLNLALFDSDVDRFKRHARARSVADALDCYRGEFMPGFSDPWIDEQRTDLAALHESLLAEVGHAHDAPPEPAPLLPLYRTAFIGRHTDIDALSRALGRHRLITLIGIGGCGKTRLAVHVAQQLPEFPLRHLVSLVDCTSASQLFDHIRISLGLSSGDRAGPAVKGPSGSSHPGLGRIVQFLEGRKALLILDNFEQLLGPAAEAAVLSLVQALPRLHLLITSRRPLQSTSAHVLALQPLPLPVPRDDEVAAAAAEAASVALFVDRARKVRSDFALNRRNLSGVIALTRLLDGVPLALELAASRIRTRTPHQIVSELEDGELNLGRSGNEPRKARHASLKAALDWSWHLLDPHQQRALLALATFNGGGTWDQAHAVIGGDRAATLLHSLMSHSLIQEQASSTGRPRFAMFNIVRKFACDRWRIDPNPEFESRHRRCFAALATELRMANALPDVADLGNLNAALANSVHVGDAVSAIDIVRGLEPYWTTHGASDRTLDTLQGLLHILTREASDWNDVMLLLVSLWVAVGRTREAQELAEEALRRAQGEGEKAKALLADANVRWLAHRDREAAARSSAEALALARKTRHRIIEARALIVLGAVTLQGPETVRQCKRHFSAALQIFRAANDPRGELRAIAGRVACQMAMGQFPAAIKAATAAEKMACTLADAVGQLQFFSRLSASFDALGQHQKALEVSRRHARLAYAKGLSYQLAYGLWNQCMPLARLGELESAALMTAFSVRYWVGRFGPLDEADVEGVADIERQVTAELGARRWKELSRRGAAMSLEEAMQLS